MVTRNLPRVGWIFAFLTLAAMLVFASLRVNESNETDLDWICDLLDAPIIFLILIGLVCVNDIGLAKTVCLARTGNDLFKCNNLVKNLESVENMAYCNEVVTDKTGVLT